MRCRLYTEHIYSSLSLESVDDVLIQSAVRKLQSEYHAGRLPFLSLEHLSDIEALVAPFEALFHDKRNLILIGIGGSSSGSKALVELLCPEQVWNNGEKRIFFVDNVDAGYMFSLQKEVCASETAILVVSKSGNTVETVSQYLLLQQWLKEQCGDTWHEHIAIVTDSEEGFLFQEALRYSYCVARIPRFMGGRYSVLSAVGILPLLFLGKDYRKFIQGAKDTARSILDNIECIRDNILWDIVLWQYRAEVQGFSGSILFSYLPRSRELGSWFMQLWAESLGKQGRGTFPIFAQGVLDQHSLQQMFLDGKRVNTCIFLYHDFLPHSPQRIITDSTSFEYINKRYMEEIFSAEYQGTVESFIHSGVPHAEYHFLELSEYSIAEFFVFFQAVVFLLGELLGINPLDQPAVEYGKKITKAILEDRS